MRGAEWTTARGRACEGASGGKEVGADVEDIARRWRRRGRGSRVRGSEGIEGVQCECARPGARRWGGYRASGRGGEGAMVYEEAGR